MTDTSTPLDAPGDRLARGVAVSTCSQMVAKVLHFGLNIVSTLAIIRYLDPGSYGNYVLVLSSTLLVGLLADFGLAKLAVREIARDDTDEHEIVGTVIATRLVLALVAVVLTQCVLTVLRASQEAHLAGFVASGMYFGDALLAVVVVFHVRVAQHYEALLRVVMELFETALLLWLIHRGVSLPVLFVPPVLATLGGAVAAIVLARRTYGTRFRVTPSRLRPLLREALPIGPALLVGVIYLKLDGLVLAALRPPREVGLYGSAYQPIEYTFLAAAVVVNVIFPLLSRAFGAGDRARFAGLYRTGTEALVAFAVFVPVVLMFTAPDLLGLFYGPDYVDAAAPLRILAVALVLMTINGWQSFVLLAGGHQRVTLRYNLAALPLAGALCLVAITLVGMPGAALAALGTSIFVLVVSTRAVTRLLDAHLDLRRLGRVLLAGALALGCTAAALGLGLTWPGRLAVAVVAYPMALVAFGFVRPAQVRAWREGPATAELEVAA